MIKQKIANEKPRIQSNSGKLTGWLMGGTHDRPVDVTDEQGAPAILREEDEGEAIRLSDVPEADPMPASHKRRRSTADEDITISSDSDSDDARAGYATKRIRRTDQDDLNASKEEDDKKKLGLNTTYDGFSIYGRILCLIVKRKGPRTNLGATVTGSSQKMLENWVSTQAAAEQVEDDADNG
jgi:regulatory protein YycI of two-component signal transduction system YycFG